MRSDELELLFARDDLRSWLEDCRRRAAAEIKAVPAEEVLARPPEQIAADVVARYEVEEPVLHVDSIVGAVEDHPVDVAGDWRRGTEDSRGPVMIPGTRISFEVQYTGPTDALRLRASRYSLNPPRAVVGRGTVTVSRDVPADSLERDRDKIVAGLHEEIRRINECLGWTRQEISASNAQLKSEASRAAEARRAKILADRDTEAALGVPLRRDDSTAATFKVAPVTRRSVHPTERSPAREGFKPEPAITDEDFGQIVSDIVTTTESFERLAVTYAGMDEERLRDQILAVLRTIYPNTTGETFSGRGKTDIYLPWEGGPVFLAECKWWRGPKKFEGEDLPQLLDRYVVWRDTHAAMIVFIGNKDASAAIDKAVDVVRTHARYLRDGDAVGGTPVFVLHKDGDPDREIKVALITVVIQG